MNKPKSNIDNSLQIVEQVELSDDEEEFNYEHVDDEFDLDEDDEDLTEALSSIQIKSRGNQSSPIQNIANSITQIRPSVADDFIRNFLIKAGMKRSLETFNAEWYELQSKGKINIYYQKIKIQLQIFF